jgi:hypothetical protein
MNNNLIKGNQNHVPGKPSLEKETVRPASKIRQIFEGIEKVIKAFKTRIVIEASQKATDEKGRSIEKKIKITKE